MTADVKCLEDQSGHVTPENPCRGCKSKAVLDGVALSRVSVDRGTPEDYCSFWQRWIVRGTLEVCDEREVRE